jgi:hypothetical protein
MKIIFVSNSILLVINEAIPNNVNGSNKMYELITKSNLKPIIKAIANSFHNIVSLLCQLKNNIKNSNSLKHVITTNDNKVSLTSSFIYGGITLINFLVIKIKDKDKNFNTY